MLKKIFVRVFAILFFSFSIAFFIFTLSRFLAAYKIASKITLASPFASPTESSASADVDPQLLKSFNGDQQALKLFEIGRGLVGVSPDDPWDDTSVFVAEVQSYDSASGKITLLVNFPLAMPYAGKTLSANLKCDASQSYVTDSTGITNNMDLLGKIAAKDLLMTMCLDENCDSLGGFCKLLEVK